MNYAERVFPVIVVDDSRGVRAAVRRWLNSCPDFEVTAECATAAEATSALALQCPQALVLDINLPDGDGLAVLHEARKRGIPVVIFSGFAASGSPNAVRARKLGALVISKPEPGSDPQLTLDALAHALRLLVKQPSRDPRPPSLRGDTPSGDSDRPPRIVLIGGSHGGLEALGALLAELPTTMPPIIVAEHLPARTDLGVEKRLSARTELVVYRASHGAVVNRGAVYVCPMGHDVEVGIADRLILRAPRSSLAPGIDRLFLSAARQLGPRAVAVILSGMGRDGAVGMRAVADAGGWTLAQTPSEALQPGMPEAAIRGAGAQEVLTIEAIARALTSKLAEPFNVRRSLPA